MELYFSWCIFRSRHGRKTDKKSHEIIVIISLISLPEYSNNTVGNFWEFGNLVAFLLMMFPLQYCRSGDRADQQIPLLPNAQLEGFWAVISTRVGRARERGRHSRTARTAGACSCVSSRPQPSSYCLVSRPPQPSCVPPPRNAESTAATQPPTAAPGRRRYTLLRIHTGTRCEVEGIIPWVRKVVVKSTHILRLVIDK